MLEKISTGITVGNFIFGAGAIQPVTKNAMNRWAAEHFNEYVFNQDGTQNPNFVIGAWGWNWFRRTCYLRYVPTGKSSRWFSNGQDEIKPKEK